MNWDESLSVGIPEIDNQHKKLVEMVNLLHGAMKAGNGKEAVASTIEGLVSYVGTHFADEQRLMATNAYPDITAHKAEHYRFVQQVLELKRHFLSGKTVLTLEVMMFVKDWLMTHIQGDDKKFGTYFHTLAFNLPG